MNFGPLHGLSHQSRIGARFYGDQEAIAKAKTAIGKKINAAEAFDLGVVTAIPDDLDWADELRVAIESRMALSPDALTGLEANLRFAQPETMATRIFGRLSAWQNWIFI